LSVFQVVKANVTARQVAEMYGLKVGRNGLACCPFHNDKTPNMKVDDRYYCFGCGVTGDAVDLTAQLLGLSPKDAALRLAADFDLEIGKAKPDAMHSYRARDDPNKKMKQWADFAWKLLSEYRVLLQTWEIKDAPQSMDDDFDNHPLFCEALQRKTYVDYLLDELMQCSTDQLTEFKKCCGKEVERIGKRLEQLAGENTGRDWSCPGNDGYDSEGADFADKEKLRTGPPRRSNSKGCISEK